MLLASFLFLILACFFKIELLEEKFPKLLNGNFGTCSGAGVSQQWNTQTSPPENGRGCANGCDSDNFLAFKNISEGGLLLSSWLRFGCFLGCASRGKSIASKLVVALFSIKD